MTRKFVKRVIFCSFSQGPDIASSPKDTPWARNAEIVVFSLLKKKFILCRAGSSLLCGFFSIVAVSQGISIFKMSQNWLRDPKSCLNTNNCEMGVPIHY